MEKTSKKEVEIIKAEKASDRPGAWLKCTLKGTDGKDHTMMIKDETLFEKVSGPGKYNVTKKQNGQYWDVIDIELLSDEGTEHAPDSPCCEKVYAPTVQAINATSAMQNRAITAQVCVKAACDVAARLPIETFKNSENTYDMGAIAEFAITLASSLMKDCGAFIENNADINP